MSTNETTFHCIRCGKATVTRDIRKSDGLCNSCDLPQFEPNTNDMFARVTRPSVPASPAPVTPQPARAVPPYKYKDSTPQLHVSDSAFEDWYQAYCVNQPTNPKQIARDAYAAGMGDPLVCEAPAVPKGWRLLKDSSYEERKWVEDIVPGGASYMNACLDCGRSFEGAKGRRVCKVCVAAPLAPAASTGDEPLPDHANSVGETLGDPHPSWPEWCATFRERKAYQVGVADARRVAAETVVVDLKHTAYDAMQQAASESKWIPPEYFANDWIADCCRWLREGPNVDAEPIDMVLHCPSCGLQHIDSPEAEPGPSIDGSGDTPLWNNPPHRSHLCQDCGHIWRPADVATNGIRRVKTRGKDDRVLFDDRPQMMSIAKAEEALRNPPKLVFEDDVSSDTIPGGMTGGSADVLTQAAAQMSLEFEKVLADYHAAVWNAADGNNPADYDEAGVDTAKRLIAMFREAITND